MNQDKSQTDDTTAERMGEEDNRQKRIEDIVASQNLDSPEKEEQLKEALASWTDNMFFMYSDEAIISLLGEKSWTFILKLDAELVSVLLENRTLRQEIQVLKKERDKSLKAKKLTTGIEKLKAREASASKADQDREASWNGIENNYNGAFVHVPTYLHFVSGAYSLDKELMAKILHNIDISPLSDPDVLSDWVPEAKEILASAIQRTLRYLLKRDESNGCSSKAILCDVIHQMVIAPLKENGQRKYEQVDIGVLVQFEENIQKRYKTVMTLDHKKTAYFDEYETESMVYGADSMSISQRSVIEVQSRGTKLNEMQYKVFGLVPFTWRRNKHATENAVTHLRSFLYEGSGLDGLLRIIHGLKECLPYYLQERDLEHSGEPLSSVTSFHPDSQDEDVGQVYKSFDYRQDRRMSKLSKRKSHVELYKKYVDKNAKLIVDADNIHVLSMKYMEPDYLAPVTVENLMKIIKALMDLHADGYIHGDIRLFNLLPGHGKIIDFDLSRKKDDTTSPKYAANLQCISDGKRANIVKEHIEGNTIQDLEMSVDHDIESMKSVLMLYDGINEGNLDSCQSLDNILSFLREMSEQKKSVSLSNETKKTLCYSVVGN